MKNLAYYEVDATFVDFVIFAFFITAWNIAGYFVYDWLMGGDNAGRNA
jgi:phage shock protein PspC (stress-responsive transcriptional regulator)